MQDNTNTIKCFPNITKELELRVVHVYILHVYMLCSLQAFVYSSSIIHLTCYELLWNIKADYKYICKEVAILWFNVWKSKSQMNQLRIFTT